MIEIQGSKASRMGEPSQMVNRENYRRLFLHVAGFVLVFLAADWMRAVSLRPEPILEG